MQHRVDRADRTPRPLSIAAISALVVAAPTAAHAQSAEAEARFVDGNRLMTAGKLNEACEAFEASNRLEPRAGTLIRLGECREQNHQLASAWSAFKYALARVKDPRKKALATSRIAALEPRLSYLSVQVPDDIRGDGMTLTRNGEPLDPATWNRDLPVDGGDYVIAAAAPGHEGWNATVTVPIEGGHVQVKVPRLREAAPRVDAAIRSAPATARPALDPAERPVPRARPTAPPHGDISSEPAAQQVTSVWTTKRKVASGLMALGGAGVATGAILGTQAQHRYDQAHALCHSTDVTCGNAGAANKLLDSAHKRALYANVAFGAAAGLAVAAGILWWVGTPESAHRGVSIVPVLAPGEAAVVAIGRL